MTDYAWVIEAGWTEPCEPAYLCGIEGSGDGMTFNWSVDHAGAIRFARRADAIKIAQALLADDATAWRVAEHAWDGGQKERRLSDAIAAAIDRFHKEQPDLTVFAILGALEDVAHVIREGLIQARSDNTTDSPNG